MSAVNKYSWKRFLIFIFISIFINGILSFIPFSSSGPNLDMPNAPHCRCIERVFGFPVPYKVIAYDTYKASLLIKPVFAQLKINNELGRCLPGCSGNVSTRYGNILINFLIVTIFIIFVDYLAVKMKSNKVYFIFLPIFLILLFFYYIFGFSVANLEYISGL